MCALSFVFWFWFLRLFVCFSCCFLFLRVFSFVVVHCGFLVRELLCIWLVVWDLVCFSGVCVSLFFSQYFVAFVLGVFVFSFFWVCGLFF